MTYKHLEFNNHLINCLLYALQTLSLFLVIKIIYRVVSNHYLKITSIVTLFVLYQYLFLRLSFTSTSLFLCFAASSYIFMKVLMNDKFSKRGLLIAVLFSFSFFIRPSIYYIYPLYIPYFCIHFIEQSFFSLWSYYFLMEHK